MQRRVDSLPHGEHIVPQAAPALETVLRAYPKYVTLGKLPLETDAQVVDYLCATNARLPALETVSSACDYMLHLSLSQKLDVGHALVEAGLVLVRPPKDE